MPRLLTDSFRSLAPIFRPPFDGLGLVVILYFAWCFLVYPHSATLRGDFPDTDDYTYATQVMDWLQGQGWYDNIQHRLNPPDGVPIHFSRLTQMPMAAITLLFKLCGLQLRAATMLMALIYPLVLLGGFLAAQKWLAKPLMPQTWTGVTAYVALFATGPLYMFTPGHIDHHGLNTILIALTLASTFRLMKEPGEPRWALLAGAVLALSLTVALEILPWLLIISACLGLWAVTQGGKAARSAFVYSLALFVASALFLLVTRPPERLFIMDALSYSAVYVILTGGIATVFAVVALTASLEAWLRWTISAGAAIFGGLAFLHQFPLLIAGPYGAMDPELAKMMLGEISEAQPMIKMAQAFASIVIHLTNDFLGLAASIYFFRRAQEAGGKAAERWIWGLLIALMTAGILLAIFYQYRFSTMLGMFSILPLSVMLQRGFDGLGKTGEGRKKVYQEFGLVLLAGPLFAVILPAIIDGRSFQTGMLLFPVDYSVINVPCDTYALEHVLNDPAYFGDRSRLVLTSMGQGPEILFRTSHKVLSAPYHMDVSGNLDATRFFSTTSEAEAESIARNRGADLVVVCRFVPDFYLRDAKPGEASGHKEADKAAGKDGAKEPPMHFVESLLRKKPPAWLKRRDFHGLNNFVIFEMQPATIAPQKTRRAE